MYVPFTNDYSSDVAGQTRILARQAAKRAQINTIFSQNNNVMGELTTECCSDPAYGGQGYYDDPSYSSADTTAAIASLVPGTATGVTSPITPPASGIPSVPLTPVDILTNTRGWPRRADGRPWPRPRVSNKFARRIASAYPDYGPTNQSRLLMPDCPCFGGGPPMVIPVPQVTNVPTNSPNPAAPSCPYPRCSTGNVCLDLITGCVANSQVTQAQVEACTKAGYSTFGNSGAWLSAIMLGCGGNLPYLGAPMPNPPTATGAMYATLNPAIAAGSAASSKARGMGGLGQMDGSNLGGFLAVMGLFGIVVWAIRK